MEFCCFSFCLEIVGIKIYCNDDKSRSFIALKVDHNSSQHLQRIVKQIDRVLKDFHLPEFYEVDNFFLWYPPCLISFILMKVTYFLQDPSFHLSILWTHGDKVKVLETALKDFTSEIHKSVIVDRVNCRIGNKYYQYLLD